MGSRMVRISYLNDNAVHNRHIDKVKMNEVGNPKINWDHSLTNPNSICIFELQIYSSNFNANDSPVNNDYLDNYEFQIDEENKNQNAEQSRSN
ncbi:hypothetical protein Smp_174120 [Schistosoma mansoni]|uniref:hypothetical protein n=1 Tax=Schistosoma mansoni TaxID=6183 RepID=UPI0001A61CE9|nr:hypothetical protein Smp_174120 [Schistosoma mansoni]|eukprot:XP_018654682.1 hypothetical protein Smp_174120 [Schistosoma mansoni]